MKIDLEKMEENFVILREELTKVEQKDYKSALEFVEVTEHLFSVYKKTKHQFR